MKFQANCNSFFITMAAESELQIRRNNADVVVLLFYVHGKHLRSCRDGQLT